MHFPICTVLYFREQMGISDITMVTGGSQVRQVGWIAYCTSANLWAKISQGFCADVSHQDEQC